MPPASKKHMKDEEVKQAFLASRQKYEPESLQTPCPENKSAKRLRAGDLCPICKSERLEYDGLLNLTCPKCGYALSGSFT